VHGTLGSDVGLVKENFAMPYHVSEDEFEAMVADALDELPEELAVAMDNVAIVVDEWPTGSVLGLYEGVPLTRRGPVGYSGVMPDLITIYRGPLCAEARDRADLVAQVRITVLHEIGHHFGIDDDRLEELGWA
jgi:predicted Zn-dependent protease with MMP-like domain